MKRKTLRFILLTIVVFLAALYFSLGPPKTNSEIRIITPPSIIASLPIWVAQEEFFFKNESLNIELVNITDSKLMVEALLSDNADVLPAVSLADLSTTGTPGNLPLMKVKIYSHSLMKKNPAFESLLVMAGSRISSLKDLEGSKVAVYPGMTSEFALRYFLRSSGVDDNHISFVKLPPPEHFLTLARDDVQAIHVYEPFRSGSLDNGKTRELTGSIYASMCEPCAIGVSVISRKFIRDNSDVAKRYYSAWNKAIHFIRSNPIKSRQILARHLGITESIASKATWVDATPTNELNFNVLEETIKMFQAAQVIPKDFILERDMVISQ